MPRKKPDEEERARRAERIRSRKAALGAASRDAAWHLLTRSAHGAGWWDILEAVLSRLKDDDWLAFMRTEARISLAAIADEVGTTPEEVHAALRDMTENHVVEYHPDRRWGDRQRVGVSPIRRMINAPSRPFSMRRSRDGHWFDDL